MAMTVSEQYFRRICGYLKVSVATLIAGVLTLTLPGVSVAKEEAKHQHHMSPNYVLNIDPHGKEIIGQAVAKEVGEFFDEAEKAIESKDITALMNLYSDGYTNGVHKKADIASTWKTIFEGFNSLAMTHNMRFVSTDPKSNVVILRCSGMITGVPKDDKDTIALDSWMNTDHVLVKEGGKFRIIGSSGADKKRLWFDKPLHPLF
jgi:ketosteroid isomerase-like protein